MKKTNYDYALVLLLPDSLTKCWELMSNGEVESNYDDYDIIKGIEKL